MFEEGNYYRQYILINNGSQLRMLRFSNIPTKSRFIGKVDYCGENNLLSTNCKLVGMNIQKR